jgi:pSer/pThr/pTyr-binding forkhead associated (FHA) protein
MSVPSRSDAAAARSDAAAAARCAAHALLEVGNGFYAGLAWPLERASTVIGRGRSADLVLHEATISRAHALLGYEQTRLFVQDLGSTNGTLVNGVREDRRFLSDGDELRMGRLVLHIRIPGAGARPMEVASGG